MNKKKVVIIGAGIGGLATAIQLAQKGFKVSIFEKNSKPGGRCQVINKDGHVFDTGPTMYLFPKIYEDFFSSIGEDVHKHLELLKADPIYRLHFPDHTSLLLTPQIEKMRTSFEKLEPGSFVRFQKFLETAKKQYSLAQSSIIQNDLRSPQQYFNLQNLFQLLKSNALENHCSFAKKFFTHPHLIAACTFQDSYLGLNPFESPAIYSIFSYSELHDGSYLPKGGMYQVILALEKIALAHGVKIQYTAPVKNIVAHDSKVSGILLENNKQITADVVLANSDLSYTYNHLLPKNSYGSRLHKKTYSCSAISFHWGIDRTYPQLQTHNLFFSPKYRESFEQVVNKKDPPMNPHFYIQAPARTDSSRTPHNQDTLSVMVPINHIYDDNPVDWGFYAAQLRSYIFSRLHNLGIKNIKQHIKFEICHLPQDWKEFCNLPYGSVYGLHHHLPQLGYLRPKRQHAKYKNLFFVGASTHPGSGLPTVLLSSKFTTKRILEYAG